MFLAVESSKDTERLQTNLEGEKTGPDGKKEADDADNADNAVNDDDNDKEGEDDDGGQAGDTGKDDTPDLNKDELALRIYNTITSSILPQLQKCVTKKVRV